MRERCDRRERPRGDMMGNSAGVHEQSELEGDLTKIVAIGKKPFQRFFETFP